MKKLTCAIAAAGALLVADTTTAIVSGGGPPPPPALDCTTAVASQGVIWPPNHKMVQETIMDVGTYTESGSVGAVAITVTAIQQDESVDALGSGNTAPDGSGVGTSTAYVRAERSGLGTGRLYFIYFSAMDDGGNTCSGMVQVQVPHDQGQGYVPVDTGQRYDSTQIVP